MPWPQSGQGRNLKVSRTHRRCSLFGGFRMSDVSGSEMAEKLWVIHIGNNDRIALRAKEEGFVCIGWTKLGNLSDLDTRKKMRTAMEAAFPGWKKRSISSSYGQPYRFAHEIQAGDLLVYPVRPTGEIAIGRISGEYRWASDDADLLQNDYANVRDVEWLDVFPRTVFSQPALHSFGSFLSVSTSDDYLEEVLGVLKGVRPSLEETGEDEDEGGADEAPTDALFESAVQETEDFLLKSWQGTGASFEVVVAAVFEAMGYTTTVTPPSGDHGVDVIAHPDPLGLERPYIKIQVKSGLGTVGEPDVNQLRGLLNQGEQGVVVSLGKFSAGALAVERSSSNLILIGPRRFVRLFLDHYDKLDPTWRARSPLKQVWIPLP